MIDGNISYKFGFNVLASFSYINNLFLGETFSYGFPFDRHCHLSNQLSCVVFQVNFKAYNLYYPYINLNNTLLEVRLQGSKLKMFTIINLFFVN